MDRNSFSILKKILIALLVLQGIVLFVSECSQNSKNYGLFVLIGMLYCIQVVVVAREHFTMVAICMGFKVVFNVIYLVEEVIRIIAVAHSSSGVALYGNIVFVVFVSLLDITVLGLMVTFYVNRHRVTSGNRGQV